MDEQQKFLADRLLSERRAITYRGLSRSLSIHVNTAKGMLFEFHQSQNAQSRGTIEALYLISGLLAPSDYIRVDDESKGQLSPSEESFPIAKSSQIMLVGEERLPEALQLYQSVTTLHIYGLQPRGAGHLWSREYEQLTGDKPTRFSKDDLSSANKYGSIYNSSVRRRDRRSAPTSTSSSITLPTKPSVKPVDTIKKPLGRDSIQNDMSHGQPQNSNSATANSRMAPGSIFHSFSKALPKPSVKSASLAQKKDEGAVALSDDGSADDFDVLPPKPPSTSHTKAKTQTEREEELRRMMEEEDDADSYGTAESSKTDQQAEMKSEPEPEPEIEPQSDSDIRQQGAAAAEADEPSEIVSSVNNGRRRGKRRVVKKKRILDEQGYMVTIQEPGWESFSEDDGGQPPVKRPTLNSTASLSTNPKKSNGKGAQGSIMSFFNKR